MEKVTIDIIENGPALIKGNVELSKGGKKIKTEEQFYLCRCGTSNNQPFCDGSHKSCDFKE